MNVEHTIQHDLSDNIAPSLTIFRNTHDRTGIVSQIRTKLRDWTIWPVMAGHYFRLVLSSTDYEPHNPFCIDLIPGSDMAFLIWRKGPCVLEAGISLDPSRKQHFHHRK